MRRETTTQKLQQAITNNLLIIEKAEIYHKTTHQTNEITAEKFKDSLDFICETIFADFIGWHCERDFEARGYIAECGRMNPNSEIIISVYLSVGDGVSTEEVEKILKVEEE